MEHRNSDTSGTRFTPTWVVVSFGQSREYIEDIYFFEVNTKYISSNVLKISVISRVRSTSKIVDIFNT